MCLVLRSFTQVGEFSKRIFSLTTIMNHNLYSSVRAGGRGLEGREVLSGTRGGKMIADDDTFTANSELNAHEALLAVQK